MKPTQFVELLSKSMNADALAAAGLPRIAWVGGVTPEARSFIASAIASRATVMGVISPPRARGIAAAVVTSINARASSGGVVALADVLADVDRAQQAADDARRDAEAAAALEDLKASEEAARARGATPARPAAKVPSADAQPTFQLGADGSLKIALEIKLPSPSVNVARVVVEAPAAPSMPITLQVPPEAFKVVAEVKLPPRPPTSATIEHPDGSVSTIEIDGGGR